MKVKYGKGGSSDGMYAEAGALITGLAKNKELRDAMKAEIAKYEEGGSVTGGDKGKKGDPQEEPKDGGTLKGASFGYGKADEYTSQRYAADGVSAEDLRKARYDFGVQVAQDILGNQPSKDVDGVVEAALSRDPSGLNSLQKKFYDKLIKSNFSSYVHDEMMDSGILVSDFRNKRTGERVSPEMKAAMEERGLTFTTDRPGLNAVYTVGKK